jgi:hypothetical protein
MARPPSITPRTQRGNGSVRRGADRPCWVLRPDRCPEGPLRRGPRGSEAPELLTTKQLEYPVTACPPLPTICVGPGPGTCLRRGSIWLRFRRWLGMPRCLLRASTTGVTTASSEGRQPSCMSPTLSLRADKPKNRPQSFGAEPISRLASRAHPFKIVGDLK